MIGRPLRVPVVISAVGVLALAAVYTPVLMPLGRIWWTDEYAGHGMFVIALSAMFVWTDRHVFGTIPLAVDRRGLLVLAAALGVLGLGQAWSTLLVEALSLVIAVAGFVWWRFGARCLRAVLFPIAFLIFMLPLPRPVVAAMTLHVQLFAAQTAGMVLDLFGVPFLQRSVYIELPGITLEVAEVCNGLRFLAALLVLTVAYAHVSQRTWPRQLVLSLAAIPVAICANATRVTGIVIAAHYVGPHAVTGFWHNVIGKTVWVATFVPLFALGYLLRRTDGCGAPAGAEARMDAVGLAKGPTVGP